MYDISIIETLKEHYYYDHDKGAIVNKRLGTMQKPRNSGKRGVYFSLHVRIKNKIISFLYHRVVWLLCYNDWPKLQIDHIDGDPSNNRIENLRLVSQKENSSFPRVKWVPNPKTKVPGVSYHQGNFQTKIHNKYFYSENAYVLFYHVTLLGKRYK